MSQSTPTNFPAYVGFWLRDSTRWMRYYWRRLFGAKETRIHGIRLPVPADFPDDRRRSLLRERLERRAVLAILTKLEPSDRVMEFGGGLGLLSTVCARRIGSDRVVSYEPNPAQIPFIKNVHAINKVQPRLVEAAIGTEDTTTRFWVRDNIVSSSLHEGDDGARPVDVKELNANGQIAEFLPTFLLCDIEGAEGAIFQNVEMDSVNKIMIELHPEVLGEDGMRDVIGRIEALGFAQISWLSSNRKRFFERREAMQSA
jgi:FkbM family methyltransferase